MPKESEQFFISISYFRLCHLSTCIQYQISDSNYQRQRSYNQSSRNDTRVLFWNLHINKIIILKESYQKKEVITDTTILTWSIPRRPLRSHSLVHSENNYYFLGIGPIRDVELTCIFRHI